ncbi:IucA/IucC family siderophore biosynthesis protein [Streptomyces sp. NBC_00536]|uniref:IucA/IucC family protein n=1 Tax=Streptomyces sp. NBC_00536 TaxID=2975769 RepID=UPI002E80D254|nr:IucA/IucC family protein [Streptomyces sp. NBC_00536]WUC82691.1 IucA/IucC family siderophore biosynthesis protein [Streptomyces sp. NBC_00536]
MEPTAAVTPAVTAVTADEYAAAPLLNCLLREAADPEGDADGVHRLRGSGRLLRVRPGRRPSGPELRDADGWHPLSHTDLVKLTADELRRYTGAVNDELPAEMADSRAAIGALLEARARAGAAADPYVRSEQSLLMGHPYHPAPKARGGAPARSWLPYAPEAHGRFPLAFLGLRADQLREEGGAPAAELFGALAEAAGAPPVPSGYVLLPAHPWQLELTCASPELRAAHADGRLLRLGTGTRVGWPTASVRTVYLPGGPAADLFAKFSLDVRITNDVRRLWRHDLLKLRRTDAAVVAAFAAVRARSGTTAAWTADLGYRTAAFAFEELAVMVREGLRAHLVPGATPLLAAALAEGSEPGPLERTADPAAWWRAYLRQVVPPVLEVFARHGVVLEAHLQNTLIAVDGSGTPVQALFRDAEGVKLLPETSREEGWQRLVYCLVVNHLSEIAATLADRHPGIAAGLWPAAREEFRRYDAEQGLPEVRDLLSAPTLPGKTNLLLRWTRADGAAARYLPLPNPLRGPEPS